MSVISSICRSIFFREKEVTKSLQLLRAIADKLEIVPGQEEDNELNEMASTTSVDQLAEQVQNDLMSNS